MIINKKSGITRKGLITVAPAWEMWGDDLENPSPDGWYGAGVTFGRRSVPRIYCSPDVWNGSDDILTIGDLLPWWDECMAVPADAVEDVSQYEALEAWTDLVGTNLTPLAEWFDDAIILAIRVARQQYNARMNQAALRFQEYNRRWREQCRRDDEAVLQYMRDYDDGLWG